MYRIQVYFGRTWRWGLNDYTSVEDAEFRVKELKAVGIKARVRLASELVA